MQIKSAKAWYSSDSSKKRLYVTMTDGRDGFYDLIAKTANGNVDLAECKAALDLSRAAAKTPGCLGAYYAPTKQSGVATPKYINRNEMERLQQDEHSEHYNR